MMHYIFQNITRLNPVLLSPQYFSCFTVKDRLFLEQECIGIWSHQCGHVMVTCGMVTSPFKANPDVDPNKGAIRLHFVFNHAKSKHVLFHPVRFWGFFSMSRENFQCSD